MIPTQIENPNGLHGKYYIQKIVPTTEEEQKRQADKILNRMGGGKYPVDVDLLKIEPCDPKAEYFVLRLDEHSSDKNHLAACRKAIITYANEIAPFLPQLSKDLLERYS